MITASLSALKQDIIFDATLRGMRFKFHSTWGLFNPKDIDEGTKLLIEQVEVQPSDTILDIGCGYGAIGLALASMAPNGTTHMVDKDFVAVQYAQKNAAANHVKNSNIYLSNGLSQVPKDVQFDLIVSNLPAKVGKELLFIMLNDAKAALNPGGKIYVVTISGLKDYIKREFKEIFGNFKKIKQSKTYVVSMAENS